MARRVEQYSDFSGGEFDQIGPYRAPKNSWTGTNMLVYRTGELGVRKGLKRVTGPTFAAGNVERLLPSGFGNEFLFTQGTAVRLVSGIDGSASLVTLSGSLSGAGAFSGSPYFSDEDVSYVATSAGLGKVDPSSLTVSSLTGSPGGADALVRYGKRLIVGGVSGSEIRYSAAANFNSWPSDNVIAVGDTTSVIGLYVQRGHLVIMKNAQTFVLTGVPGENETLREVDSYTAGFDGQRSGVVERNGPLWVGWTRNGFVSHFNGSIWQDESQFNLESGGGGTGIVGAEAIKYGYRGHVFLYGVSPTVSLLLRHHGVWSKHILPVIAAGGSDIKPIIETRSGGQGPNGNSSLLIITDTGTGSVAPKFYMLKTGEDSPGLESGTFQRAGDDSTTPVTGSVDFPEWHSPNASEVFIRSVIVDFRSWNTGGSQTNHFDLAVKTLRRYDATESATGTVSFDQAVASSSTSGTIQRRVFNLDDTGQPTAGFQLSFTNIRGVAIQRIHVVIDDGPARW